MRWLQEYDVFCFSNVFLFSLQVLQISEPGIHRGNEDSRRIENRKSQKNKLTSILFFLIQPVGVAESM